MLVSVLIHYFTLVAVMWMGAEAVLMFKKLVIVFVRITTRYIVAVSLVCWCKFPGVELEQTLNHVLSFSAVVPIVPVVISLAIERDFMVTFSPPLINEIANITDRGLRL